MSLLMVFVVFGVAILLGVLSIVLSKNKIHKDTKYFEEFVVHVKCILSSKANQKKVSEHLNYILENYQAVSSLAGEDIYHSPISELGACLSYANPIDQYLYPRIVAELSEFKGEKNRENQQLTKQLRNPFILLYRGVELVMNFVFGYIISKFNPDFNHDTSIIWRILNTMITVFGSVASILSYLSHL